MPKKSWSKGAKKAYAGMLKTYGSKAKAEQVFYNKARKQGHGGSINQQVSKTYKTRGKQK